MLLWQGHSTVSAQPGSRSSLVRLCLRPLNASALSPGWDLVLATTVPRCFYLLQQMPQPLNYIEIPLTEKPVMKQGRMGKLG